jgi:hypothetical protein
MIKAISSGRDTCTNCDQGFRRVHGIHIGSQRLGMIPDSPCRRVFAATQGDNTTKIANRSWTAHIDGDVLRQQSGKARRFSSAKAAYAAACQASPRQWHP